jgi:hypothetical protein
MGEWMVRWPTELFAAVEVVARREAAQQAAEAQLLQALNSHLWRPADCALPSQIALLRAKVRTTPSWSRSWPTFSLL